MLCPRSSKPRLAAALGGLLCAAVAVAAPRRARGDDGVAIAPLGDAVDPVAEIQYFLGRARARPGDHVRLLFSIRTLVPLKSLDVALDFDESRIRVLGGRQLTQADGSPALVDSLSSFRHNNLDQEPGNQTDEGWIFARLDTGAVASDLGISSGEPVAVLALEFEVLRRAPPGFTPIVFTVIRSKETLEPAMVFENGFERAAADGPLPPEVLGEDSFEGGGIEIIGEVGFFSRGDANYDGGRDISDGIYTLKFLFAQGSPLPCDDSGDANDDGVLDVSDPIYTLMRLFVNSEPFPPPAIWGQDPTPDALGCAVYES